MWERTGCLFPDFFNLKIICMYCAEEVSSAKSCCLVVLKKLKWRTGPKGGVVLFDRKEKELEKRVEKECQQHPGFPGGHPSKY